MSPRLSALARRPWYPLAFLWAAVLTLYVGIDASPAVLVRPLLIGTVAVLLLLFGLRLILRNADIAGIVVGLAMLALIAGDANRAVLAGLMALLVVAISSFRARARRQRLSAAFITQTANPFSAILLLAVVISGITNGVWVRSVGELVPTASPSVTGDPQGPDIYLILLDGYARADTMQRILDFDNSAWLDALAERGFDVATRSRSNYMHTSLTLGSMLQMAHIAETGRLTRAALLDNPAFTAFRSKGYEITTTAVPWDFVTLTSADRMCNTGHASEFEMQLLRNSLLRAAFRESWNSFAADRQRRFVEGALDCAAERHGGEAPQLVFAHVGSPHWPIVFDRDGGPAGMEFFTGPQERPLITQARKDAYLAQVQYVNSRALQTIDSIVAADRDAVIVLFSDHGSEFGLDAESLERTDVDERTSNLFAARTPGHRCLFGDGPTPVNIIPILLATYLDHEEARSSDDIFASAMSDLYALQRIPNRDADPSC